MYQLGTRPGRSTIAGFWGRMRRDRAAMLALALLALLVLLAMFAPLLTTRGPLAVDFAHVREAPSSEHWLGTDRQGRDILTRLLFGARISLAVGLLSQPPILALGVLVGYLAGYRGGLLDAFLMRLTDVFYAFPTMLFLILIMTVTGRSFGNVLLALSITSWTTVARLVRGQVLQLKQQEFMVAARATGASEWRMLFRHLLPNLAGLLLVVVSSGVPGAIVAEAGLSFLGLGLTPPVPSWGLMLAEGFSVLRSSPHLALAPGLALGATMLALFVLGDSIRDALDPMLVEGPRAGERRGSGMRGR